MRNLATAIVAAIGTLAVVAAIALIAVFTGFYNVAATSPHLAPVAWLIDEALTRSVREHSEGIEVPRLDDPELLSRGAVLYSANCLICHETPSARSAEMSKAMRPQPPDLSKAAGRWSPAEVYWIIRNGIKMTGMPAWGQALPDRDLWALTAFVERLATGSREALQNLVREGAQGISVPALQHPGLVARGAMLYSANCALCHGVPGVRPSPVVRSMRPQPRDLAEAAADWSPAEIFWIVKNGLPMTGMPAWRETLSDADLWALAAFVERLPQASAGGMPGMMGPGMMGMMMGGMGPGMMGPMMGGMGPGMMGPMMGMMGPMGMTGSGTAGQTAPISPEISEELERWQRQMAETMRQMNRMSLELDASPSAPQP